MGTIKTTISQRTSPAGEKKLYANIVRYSNIDSNQLIESMMQNSLISRAAAVAAVYGTRSCVYNFLLNGHTINIPGLGKFSLTLRTKAQDSADKVTGDTIKGAHIRFSPEARIRSAAKSTKFIGVLLDEDDQLEIVH